MRVQGVAHEFITKVGIPSGIVGAGPALPLPERTQTYPYEVITKVSIPSGIVGAGPALPTTSCASPANPHKIRWFNPLTLPQHSSSMPLRRTHHPWWVDNIFAPHLVPLSINPKLKEPCAVHIATIQNPRSSTPGKPSRAFGVAGSASSAASVSPPTSIFRPPLSWWPSGTAAGKSTTGTS